MSKMCHDNEFVQFDTQLALLTVIFVDQSLLIVNIIKHTTHNAI